jgi:hypothetical protein
VPPPNSCPYRDAADSRPHSTGTTGPNSGGLSAQLREQDPHRASAELGEVLVHRRQRRATCAATGMSSKPTTLTSIGTRRPASGSRA